MVYSFGEKEQFNQVEHLVLIGGDSAQENKGAGSACTLLEMTCR
jgi:hypothetical protein